MSRPWVLISHVLCPYAQRVAIALREKGIAFERIDVDLSNKPGWFLAISPLGKTPVLLVDDRPIFESAVICEFLEDTTVPNLHPDDALERARHRSWIEFGSALLNAIAGFYNAADEATLEARAAEIRYRFEQIESELRVGPYFAGERFSLVDAVFGPVFRYFDVFEEIAEFGFFANTPRVLKWRNALSLRQSVREAVRPDYPVLLRGFLQARASALSNRIRDLAA